MSISGKGNKHNVTAKRNEAHTEKIAETTRKKYIVTSPDGNEFEIKGLAKFCRENNLQTTSMCQVMSGKRKHCSGWKCRHA